MDTWFGYQHYWNKFLNIKWGTQSLAVSVNPGYLCVLRGLGCVCVSTRVCEDACTDASPEQRGLRKMSGVLLHQSSSLSFIPFIPLRQGLSLNLDLCWRPASLGVLPPPPLPGPPQYPNTHSGMPRYLLILLWDRVSFSVEPWLEKQNKNKNQKFSGGNKKRFAPIFNRLGLSLQRTRCNSCPSNQKQLKLPSFLPVGGLDNHFLISHPCH